MIERVLLTRHWPIAAEERLQSLFPHVKIYHENASMGIDELHLAAQEYDAILPNVADHFPGSVFDQKNLRLKILANFGVGFNHINIEAARSAGVVVTNTPDVLTECSADLTMALMLALMRRLGEGEREIRNEQWGGWHPTHLLGRKLSGKTLGIIGFGRIGQAVARRAHYGFGMPVRIYNRSPISEPLKASLGIIQCASILEVASECDVFSLHIPGGVQTRHLIDRRTIFSMRPDAFLINTARGDVIDQSALIDALEQGKIAGAALDVFEDEPKVPAALKRLENVVLSPHLGSATEETRLAMGMMAIDNLEIFAKGGTPPNRVV